MAIAKAQLTPVMMPPVEQHRPPFISDVMLDDIQPSRTNPRKHFDQAKLEELAASIRAHGVLEPILLRSIPVSQAKGKLIAYEIVAGERRFRAAKLAGLKSIPAIVKQLDDKAMMEIQFIENLQREDLSAMEEAQGYRTLIDQHGYTVESLAYKLDKSRSYVYGVLNLCKLPDAAAQMVESGELPVSHAQLIARIPDEKLRVQAALEIIQGEDQDGPMTFAQAQHYVASTYMRELKAAPFGLKDAALLPSAGSCETCQFRTGNQPDLYPGTRADVCTRPPCYAEKIEAHQRRLLDEAKTAGATVIEGKEAKKFFSWGEHLDYSVQQKYVNLASQCWQDKKSRSYK